MKLRPGGTENPDTSTASRSPLVTLAAVAIALAAVAGAATLGGDAGAAGPAGDAQRAPVERSTLVCPQPSAAESAATRYTAFTPGEAGDAEGGSGLSPLVEHTPGTGFDPDEDEDGDENQDDPDSDSDEEGEGEGDDEDAEEAADGEGQEAGADDADRVLAGEQPGAPVTDTVDGADAPALAGTADGALAPGWTVQQTTLVRGAADGRGLLGTTCQQPDTAFWFAGASSADDRSDYVHLTNPDSGATVVDIDLFGPEGRLAPIVEEGITVPGGATVRVRLTTLTEATEDALGVHVAARTGRIGAQIQAVDAAEGADWLAPVTAPDGPVVLPGIPADAESVRLVAFTPGESDITARVGFAGPTSTITPAGNETVHLRAGMVESVDLDTVVQGEAGSLVLTPEGDNAGPIVAALLVTREEDGEREFAFLPATAAVEGQATATGNVPGNTELVLTATTEDAEVEITTSPGNEGGTAATDTLTVPAGTTVTYAPESADDIEGRYALTVRRTGGGALYAARILTEDRDDVPMFTVQTLPDDRSTVSVPHTSPDLGVVAR